MFKGKNRALDIQKTDTLIGEGTVFTGKVKSEASIRIEGQITGDVECAGDVTVGENGVVKSNITARDVILAGTVHGNVICKGRLTIRATGKLLGNTTATSLIIDEGGVFQGMSKMESGAAQPEKSDKPEEQSQNPSYTMSSNSTAVTWP